MVQASEQIAEQTTLNNDRQPRRNPAIEAVLANGQLAIEYGFGMQCLNQYLTDLSLLAHGASYKDLGIEQRRRSVHKITFGSTVNGDSPQKSFNKTT